jgi:hypothetical protein
MKHAVIFNCLTQREVDFYLAAADKLKSKGIESLFISFFQPGNKKIKSKGYLNFDFYEYLKNPKSMFPIKNLNLSLDQVILHEQVTFGIEPEELKLKMQKYLNTSMDIFSDILKDSTKNYILVQELGGFVSSLSIFYVAVSKNIPHYFLEPAFFKGRLHAVKNSIFALVPSSKPTDAGSADVFKYIQNLKNTQSVAIPVKDRHHFQDMRLAKIVNGMNFTKIWNKFFSKFIKREKFEFNHIWYHCYRYIQMYVSRKFRKSLYSAWSTDLQSKQYIYVPLHVELDYSLTIRSPKYFDQLYNIESLLKELPSHLYLYTKEHPASIGGFSNKTLKRLLDKYKNFKLIHPMVNSFEIIKNCSAIVTINSKVGMESLIFEKPVIVLGDAVYSYCEEAIKAKDAIEAAQILNKISKQKFSPDTTKIKSFFDTLYADSFPTELYEYSEENVKRFSSAVENLIP